MQRSRAKLHASDISYYFEYLSCEQVYSTTMNCTLSDHWEKRNCLITEMMGTEQVYSKFGKKCMFLLIIVLFINENHHDLMSSKLV